LKTADESPIALAALLLVHFETSIPSSTIESCIAALRAIACPTTIVYWMQNSSQTGLRQVINTGLRLGVAHGFDYVLWSDAKDVVEPVREHPFLLQGCASLDGQQALSSLVLNAAAGFMDLCSRQDVVVLNSEGSTSSYCFFACPANVLALAGFLEETPGRHPPSILHAVCDVLHLSDTETATCVPQPERPDTLFERTSAGCPAVRLFADTLTHFKDPQRRRVYALLWASASFLGLTFVPTLAYTSVSPFTRTYSAIKNNN